ncbi:MAG: hypothetical protein Q4D31_00475 [Eubacteriales bacterium]|nr:hypothetical protein [Eubacteriales bacterium]
MKTIRSIGIYMLLYHLPCHFASVAPMRANAHRERHFPPQNAGYALLILSGDPVMLMGDYIADDAVFLPTTHGMAGDPTWTSSNCPIFWQSHKKKM